MMCCYYTLILLSDRASEWMSAAAIVQAEMWSSAICLDAQDDIIKNEIYTHENHHIRRASSEQ